MKITASKSFYKSFGKYDHKFQQHISNAIEKLPSGDVKKLKGNNVPSLFRLRIRDIRVVFTMNSDSIHLVDIDNRGHIDKQN